MRYVLVTALMIAGCSSPAVERTVYIFDDAGAPAPEADAAMVATGTDSGLADSGGAESGDGLVIDAEQTDPAHSPQDPTSHWDISRSCPQGARFVEGGCVIVSGSTLTLDGSQEAQGWLCSYRNDSDEPITVGLHLVCAY